ncbi:hypothetical protein PEC302107_24560 [Pectobacterium araliae]|uniref:tail fiber protein n=1 Tax=Pectobacterium araliae TaxID=3073862 RepID=UPI00208C1174|nr:hypothetical protein PEC302107_24560 [Pectobacterium carotovorum subsp. carotovorum]
MIRSKKGFSLLELILVLGVASAVSFMKFQDLKQEQENTQAKIAGEQLKQIGEAVNGYISIRYDKLSTLTTAAGTGTDPGPRTCSANGCEITYQTLVNEGLLPAGYTGVNMQKSSYKILLKRAGSTPNYVINGLVVTTLPWSEGNRIRYDLLGRAMQAAGIDSGMTQSTSVASGTGGQWTENQSNFAGINAAGLLAYRVGYDSSMYSVYLRRDGTLPMTGDLNMGGKDIDNAGSITASGSGNFGSYVKSGGNITATTGFGDLISIGGDKVNRDYEIILHTKGLPLMIHDQENSTSSTILKTYGNIEANGNIIASKDILSSGSIYAKNGYGDTIKLGGDGTGNDFDMAIGGGKPLNIQGNNGVGATVQVRGEFNIANGGLMANKLLSLKGDGTIWASGNISSDKTISGQYLQPTSTVVLGAACESTGLISKDANGMMLTCRAGVWKSISDFPVGSPIPWPAATPPIGWLVCNGQAFNKSAYPSLAKAYPTGFLPDLRGVFIRGWDNGRGLDAGRVLGNYQDDALQKITGSFPVANRWRGYFDGSFRTTGNWNTNYKNGGSDDWGKQVQFDSSYTTRSADETRPKNVAFSYIVKAE